MRTETTMYRALKKHVIKPYDRIDRIENPLSPGMPDVNLCIAGVDSWLELKAPVEPKRIDTPLFGSSHPVLQSQLNWFLRQCRAGGGGKSYLCIATDKRWLLIPGHHLEGVNKKCVNQLLHISLWYSYSRNPTVMEWETLRHILGYL